jgi:hypothetical protein
MKTTEFYSDAYAYAVGYRDGRATYRVDECRPELPDVAKFTAAHQSLYGDGYAQGVRDYYAYDHAEKDPLAGIVAPVLYQKAAL